MNTKEKNLASRLLYLPLDLHEKVLLWLAYKGLKPVSEITASRRGNVFKLLKKGIKPKSNYYFNSSKSKRIRKWIKGAGLFIAIEQGHDMAWHVSKNSDLAKLSTKSLHKLDIKNEIKTGQLFGFPETSIQAYAQNRNKNFDETLKVMVGTGELLYKNEYLKDKYFTPYIFYNMPKNRVKEDSQVAKVWADTIRHDVPKLATWFENKSK